MCGSTLSQEARGLASASTIRLRRLEAVQAREVAGVLVHHAALVSMTMIGSSAVALAHLEVVRIVRGRDLDRAGAELGIDGVVRDDRDLAPQERQDRRLPDERRVALVLGVHRHRGVAQHRLGPRRRHRHASASSP